MYCSTLLVKKVLVIVFTKEFDKATEKGGLRSFNDEFLQQIVKDYRDADILVVDTDKCSKTAEKYGLPSTSNEIHFAVNFRFKSTDDYFDSQMTDIVQELLNKSDPSRRKLTTKEKAMISDFLEKQWGKDRMDENLTQKVQELVNKLSPKEQQKAPKEQQKAPNEQQIAPTQQQIVPAQQPRVTFNENNTATNSMGKPQETGGEQTRLRALHGSGAGGNIISRRVLKKEGDKDKLDENVSQKVDKIAPNEQKKVTFDENTIETNSMGKPQSMGGRPSLRELVEKSGNGRKAIPQGQAVVGGQRTTEKGITFVTVVSDEELQKTLLSARREFIVMLVINNSLNYDESMMKNYLEEFSTNVPNVKIIQVVVSEGQCMKTIDMYTILSYPMLIFIKHGKTLGARVTKYKKNVIDAEMSNLFLPIAALVDNDLEFRLALKKGENDLIIVHITNDSLDQSDCDLKTFLSEFSKQVSHIKIIQVHTNSGKCGKVIDTFRVTSYPLVLFGKRGQMQAARVPGFNKVKTISEIMNLLSRSEVVDTDEELENVTSNADNDLIILHITNNSLNDDDCNLKRFLSDFSSIAINIRIIQVNANTGRCKKALTHYTVQAYPLLLFVKRGKILKSRVTGFRYPAIEAEISVLMSNSELMNTDEEINGALLSNANNELIIVLVTDNSLTEADCEVKKLLYSMTDIVVGIRIVQVNRNSDHCAQFIEYNNITSYPTLLFKKNGKMQSAWVTGYARNAIVAEISNLKSLAVVVDSDNELNTALSNANNELIVLFVTDNSLEIIDCAMKDHLSDVSHHVKGVKIIQVNYNTGECEETTRKYNVTSLPTVLFVKFGKIQDARVTGDYGEKAIDAEISNLLARSTVVNCDSELDEALSRDKEQLIIMFFTDNSMDECDCQTKEYLSTVSQIITDITFIQVNVNSDKFGETKLDQFCVKSYPSLIFKKYGEKLGDTVTGCSTTDVSDAIDKLREKIPSKSVVPGTISSEPVVSGPNEDDDDDDDDDDDEDEGEEDNEKEKPPVKS